MKTLFIPVSVKTSIDFIKLKGILQPLPKNLALVYSIQYREFAGNLKKELSKTHNILHFSQILGCSNLNFSDKVEAILIITDGKFYALSLAYQSKKPVYLFERDKLIKIPSEELISFEKRKKASYVNFLNSSKVGVLISTKPGQQKLKMTLNLKKKFPNKKFYFFISNNLNLKESENFGLDFWINTACPRLDMDSSRIINIGNLMKF